MRYTFIVQKVTNILYVDWFLLSKLCLKRVLSHHAAREYGESQQHYETRGKAGLKSKTWLEIT